MSHGNLPWRSDRSNGSPHTDPPRPAPRNRARAWRALVLSGFALLATTTPTLARLEVNVTRVGFPTINSGHVYRTGEWTPVIVDVDLLDQSSFDGTIRASQYDLDGDQAFDSVEVHLAAETGGSARRFLYLLGNPLHGDGNFSIEVLDAEGESVEVVSQGVLTYRPEPAQQPVAISDVDMLILSVSTSAIGRVGELVESSQQALYYPPVHVGHLSPSELPGLALGLAAVDYIVWDDADPTDLTERQRRALIEWVHGGGTLLIAAARTVGAIEASLFAEHLPVDLGATRSVDHLPTVRRLLIGPPSETAMDLSRRRREVIDDSPWYEASYPNPITIVQTTARPTARVLAHETLPPSPVDTGSKADIADLPIVSERWVGHGRLIFCAATLRDLLSGPDNAADFFEKMFLLVRESDNEAGPPQPISLFGSVVSAVAFSTSSSLYLFLAFLFSVSYLLISTVGTWWLLGRRGRRHHAWSAFAVVGGCAILVSLGAVGWARGLGERVHQLSIVDADAGSRFGRGVAFFGLKTASDQELDLWLPSDPTTALEPGPTTCTIRPLPPSGDPVDVRSGFADPEAYQLAPAIAGIKGVRIRSTLKRFEGRWEGPLAGSVEGRIVMNRDGTLNEESFIRNGLGIDLKDCYLFHAQLDPFDSRRGSLTPTPRDSAIYTYPMERLPNGERVGLAPLCNPKPDPTRPGARLSPPRLQDRHIAWAKQLLPTLPLDFGSRDADYALGQERIALLIASTVGEFDVASMQGMGYFSYGRRTCSRDRLRTLDVRARLRRDTAILVGFADDPGPIRLFRRSGRAHRALEPEPRRSTTLYRVRIPVVWPDATTDDTVEIDPSP